MRQNVYRQCVPCGLMFNRKDYRRIRYQVLAPYLMGYADRRAEDTERALDPEPAVGVKGSPRAQQ